MCIRDRSGIPTRSASRSGIASSRLATNSGQRTCAKQHLRTAAGRPRKVRNSGTMGSGTPGMRTTGNSGRPGNLNPGGKLHPSPSEPHPRQARTVRQTATRNRGRQQPAPRETAPEPFRGYGIPLPSQHTQCRKIKNPAPSGAGFYHSKLYSEIISLSGLRLRASYPLRYP